MAASDAIERFTAAAARLGIEVQALRYPDGTRTAEDAANAVGCDVAQIVKSLVFSTADGPVLALTSGANRVDTSRLGVLAAAEIGRADADEVRAATGFSIGGTPPFGHTTPLSTWIDIDLLDHDQVWAAAGTPDSCFPIAPSAKLNAGSEVGSKGWAERLRYRTLPAL